MNKWVLITGASQGIGHEFAKLFAADNYNLALAARDRARLEEVAAEVKTGRGIETRLLPQDLAQPGAARALQEELSRAGITVDILVNNAGFGTQGLFAEVNPKLESDLIQVNVAALVELTRLLLPGMLARRQGRILNVASTAAFQPGPRLALYYASKAFVYSFSCALAEEVAGTGVTVTTLCPGLTRSQFHSRAGLHRPGGFVMMNADEVARIGYRALMKGRPIVVSGWFNWCLTTFSKISPTRLTTKVAGMLNAPGK